MAGGGMTGEHEARRTSWLMFLGGGEKFQRNFLQGLRQAQRSARDEMGAPVVNVSETTEAAEIARVLTRCCIQAGSGRARQPCRRDRQPRVPGPNAGCRAVPVVFCQNPASSARDGRRSRYRNRGSLRPPRWSWVAGLSARRFRSHNRGRSDRRRLPRISSPVFEHQKAEHRVEARDEAAQGRRGVEALIGLRSTDEGWRSMIHHAREAAEHGKRN